MKVTLAVLLVCVFAMGAQAGLAPLTTTLIRTPQHDSAIIQSDRVGGNFAYSTVEGHAYAAVQPVVQDVVKPVAVTYSAHVQPAVLSYAAHHPFAGAYSAIPHGVIIA